MLLRKYRIAFLYIGACAMMTNKDVFLLVAHQLVATLTSINFL